MATAKRTTTKMKAVQVARMGAAVPQRVEGGDARAKERPRFGGVQALGYRGESLHRRNHVFLIAAVVADAGDLLVAAVDEISPPALRVVGTGADPIQVTPAQLILGTRAIQGWASGTPADSEDTLRFAELSGVRPMIETYPLEKAAEAYGRMMSGKAEFRVVLTM